MNNARWAFKNITKIVVDYINEPGLTKLDNIFRRIIVFGDAITKPNKINCLVCARVLAYGEEGERLGEEDSSKIWVHLQTDSDCFSHITDKQIKESCNPEGAKCFIYTLIEISNKWL